MSRSLETTQACSPASDLQPPGPTRLAAVSGESAINHKAPGLSATELAPIRFGQSRRLWQYELAIYLALLLCATLALLPFILTSWYWPCVWLGVVLVIGRQASHCWRREFSTRSLYCVNQHQQKWYLRDVGGEREVALGGEILLWPHIIVLPIRTADGHKTHLVFTPDAMDADDWRRLRVWLRFFTDKP